MNSIHNNGENDTSLNDGLDKLGQAYGRLEQEEPPELLDQAILNSAHRAVEKKPHWMKFGWLHGLTTTAVFVLAFSLILNQPESTPVFEDEISNNEPAPVRRDRAAKKQSLDIGSDAIRMEMKEKSETRQDLFKSKPAAAAPEVKAMESAPEDEAGQPALKAQRSMYTEGSLQRAGVGPTATIAVSGWFDITRPAILESDMNVIQVSPKEYPVTDNHKGEGRVCDNPAKGSRSAAHKIGGCVKQGAALLIVKLDDRDRITAWKVGADGDCRFQ